ncbi:hypothetical protein LTR10_015870 [Elasticomyces elasticus]|nr:hypothetical protein LTR10_015870 [Elasticomyces elasticus]KAK4974674.1 hypothetical protein LTR42_005320 [Elasticomyces elasticus]
MPERLSIEDKLQACINTLLREEYPFTYPSIISKIASETATSAASMVVQRKKACKRGVRLLQFMDLPPELRNRIHEYTVSYYDTLNLPELPAAAINLVYELPLQPMITRVSRQLRKETLSMFYATNRFFLNLDQVPDRELMAGTFIASKWLRAIGATNAEHIKFFRIRYDPRLLRISMDTLLAESGLSLVAGMANFEPNSRF